MRRLILVLLLLLSSPFPRMAHAQTEAPPAEISADLGPCSALIAVTDAGAKPVYGAKVSARVQYGMMGVKKLDLEAFTGADGKLKITRLPDTLKKPLIIHIDKDGKADQVEFKPGVQCHATFDVQLK
ncbi:MAG TPA: hypothetical protein VGL22_11340 [Terracidiphilus sp.]|jgi:hypothetical protein